MVLLGVHDLDQTYESYRQTFMTKEIIIHPDWSCLVHTYDADISIVVLEFPVEFNNFIKPICLWGFDELPTESTGVVVGFGKSENEAKNHENMPKKLQIPIITNEKCFNEDQLSTISSGRTFCAGASDGSGVCFGDSGGGLYIKHENTFFLRGIVSSSLVTSDNMCNTNRPAIFTDVIKYKDWIFNSQSKANSSNFITNPCASTSVYFEKPRELNKLLVNQCLGKDTKLVSANQKYELRMQTDANFVLYKILESSVKSTWSSVTDGKDVERFCLHESTWALCSEDKPIRISWFYGTINNFGILQDDGNFVVYTADNVATWATMSVE